MAGANPDRPSFYTRVKHGISAFAAPDPNANPAAPNKSEAKEEYGEDVQIVERIGISGGSNLTDLDNFDTILSRKGTDTYDKMMADAQVRQAINDKRFAVISADWDILAAGDDAQDKEIADFVRSNMMRCRGSVVSVAWSIMEYLIPGYSIAEMNFEPCAFGDYRDKWMLKNIRGKRIQDYEFGCDKYNNIEKLFLVQNYGTKKEIPLWKFVIATYQPQYDRVFGRSDLRAAYKHWFSKDFLLKFWNMWLEMFGSPLRVATLPANQMIKDSELQAVLKRLTNNTAITLPGDFKIEFIQAASHGRFKEAIEYHDKMIAKAILGQTLTGGEGDRVGSMALGNVHQETREDWVTFLRRDLEEIFNERIIKTLVDMNYPPVDEYPSFVWQPRKGKLIIANVDDVVKLLDAGMITNSDANILRDQLDLPYREDLDNSDVFVPTAKPAAGGMFAAVDMSKLHERPTGAASSYAAPAGRTMTESNMYACERRLGGVSYYQKQIEKRDTFESELMQALRPIYEQIRASVMKQSTKLINDGGDLDTLAIPKTLLAQLQRTSATAFSGLAADQYAESLNAVDANKKAIPDVPADKFAAEEADVSCYAMLLKTQPPEAALSEVERWKVSGEFEKIKKARTLAVSRIVAQQKRRASFWITDVTNTEVLEKTKKAIFSGLESGSSNAQIERKISGIFEGFIKRGEQLSPELNTARRLEVIVRTNTSRAINESQRIAYQDPAVTDEFPGMLFSAIMDESTSDICASFDGSTYRSNEPLPIILPAHYNCRSEWIPVQYNDPEMAKGFAPDPAATLNESFEGKKFDSVLNEMKSFGSIN